MPGKERIVGLRTIKSFFREALRRKKEPKFELCDEAKETLRELISRDNPRGSEALFLATGKGYFVEKVYTIGFPENSGFRFIDERILESSVGHKELKKLLETIRSSGGGGEIVLFVGHLHPSGTVNVQGQEIEILPSKSLLFPSQEDLKKMREGIQSGLSYEAIAANTEKGPCLAIYPLRPTLVQKNPKKLPRTIIDLSA